MAGGFFGWLRGLFGSGADAASDAAEKAAGTSRRAVNETRETVSEMAKHASGEASRAGAAVSEAVDEAADAASRMAREAGETASAAIRDVSEAASDFATSAAETVASTVETAADAVRDTTEAAAAAFAGPGATAAAAAAVSSAISGSDDDEDEGGDTVLSLTVNGRKVETLVEDNTLLVDFLRNERNLTGTHVGCDTSQCGACVVHVDGQAVKSCTMLAVQAEGSEVVTIEGLASGGDLHPMQAAFREHHGLQCGFCTPGMIMAGVDIVNRKGTDLDAKTIRAELEGNICRCTGYHNIVKSIQAGAQGMSSS